MRGKQSADPVGEAEQRERKERIHPAAMLDYQCNVAAYVILFM